MNIYERLSKALRKKWARFGCGPEIFQLNIHHWEQLRRWLGKNTGGFPESMCRGKPTMFMGTKLLLKYHDNPGPPRYF